jgi:hypothetical protein
MKYQNGPRDPRDPQDRNADQFSYDPADQTPRKEGGEDSIENMSPTDDNADEKVIVNEQREHKTVNAPSQTAANTSEGISSDEDTIDNS